MPNSGCPCQLVGKAVVVHVDLVRIWSVICSNVLGSNIMQRAPKLQSVDDVLRFIRNSRYSSDIVIALDWWMYVTPAGGEHTTHQHRNSGLLMDTDHHTDGITALCNCLPGWVVATPALARVDLLEAVATLVDAIHCKTPSLTSRDQDRMEYHDVMLNMCVAAKYDISLVISILLFPLVHQERVAVAKQTWDNTRTMPLARTMKHMRQRSNHGRNHDCVSAFNLLAKHKASTACATVHTHSKKPTPPILVHQCAKPGPPVVCTKSSDTDNPCATQPKRKRARTTYCVPTWATNDHLPIHASRHRGLIGRWRGRMHDRKHMRTNSAGMVTKDHIPIIQLPVMPHDID
jgi:hypothetical protein